MASIQPTPADVEALARRDLATWRTAARILSQLDVCNCWVHNKCLRTVVETPTFQKQADAVWAPAEREAFIDFIAEHPDSGEVIPGADGARKVRWQRRGTGKRGGVRVVYFHLVGDQVVLLVMIYAKAHRSNVSPAHIPRS